MNVEPDIIYNGVENERVKLQLHAALKPQSAALVLNPLLSLSHKKY
jgi:hypothetical protein